MLSLIGAFYYLRVVKVMYFDEPTDRAPIVASTASAHAAVAQRRGGAGARPAARRPDGAVRAGDRQGAGDLTGVRMARCVRAVASHGVRMTPPPTPTRTCASRRLRSEQVYRGHFLDVRRDHVRLPDGGTATREYIVHPGAVMVVPLLDDGRLVVERQCRYPLGARDARVPGRQARAPASRRSTARVRELAEETGYRAAEWARAGILHNAIAYSNEGIEIWFARGLTLGERHLDAGEFLDVVERQRRRARRAGRGAASSPTPRR